jgi:hypothetical protein
MSLVATAIRRLVATPQRDSSRHCCRDGGRLPSRNRDGRTLLHRTGTGLRKRSISKNKIPLFYSTMSESLTQLLFTLLLTPHFFVSYRHLCFGPKTKECHPRLFTFATILVWSFMSRTALLAGVDHHGMCPSTVEVTPGNPRLPENFRVVSYVLQSVWIDRSIRSIDRMQS